MILTTIAVAATAMAGPKVAGSFIAGVGAATVVIFVVLTNRSIERHRQK